MGIFSFQVKSITVDHGKEFANYQSLEQDYQIKVYFFQATSDEILAALELINHLSMAVC